MADAAGGRLDRAPDPADLIIWPDDLGRRFALFVDTEEEFDWNDRASWNGERTESVRSIPAANARLRDGGAHPVYLTDYPIADDSDAAATLRALADAGDCDIGAQLHPWNTPPIGEASTPANSFVGNLDAALERAKIVTLRDRMTRAFGAAPASFRAGRYGVGPNSASILEELGFALDVSARPLFDYRDEGGPDFSAMGPGPFWAGDKRTLIALPLSATRIGTLRGVAGINRLAERSSLVRSILSRARLSARIALTPEGMPIAEAGEAVRILLGEGVGVLSFSFHSPSLEPGHTPYVRDAGDLSAFWRWWDTMFALLASRGVTAIDTAGIVAAAWTSRAGRGATLASAEPRPLSPDR